MVHEVKLFSVRFASISRYSVVPFIDFDFARVKNFPAMFWQRFSGMGIFRCQLARGSSPR